jgi:thioredoxin reductase (NADPH)
MSAAINGASEGLRVCMIDGNSYLGGQARESNAIENYPGFPDGVTGNDLMNRFTAQAIKFETQIHCPVRAVKLHKDGDVCVVTAEDYTEYRAKTVLLSLGLSYRRLDADNIGQFMGKGVYYGLPSGSFESRKKCQVTVVGGANSAGQAVLKLASNKNASIRMLIRRTITDQMSRYLIDRIRELENVEVLEGESVVACRGSSERISHIQLASGGEVCTDGMFIFIGATPKTMWLQDTLQLDDKKFIRTWNDVTWSFTKTREGFDVLPYETSMKGVFAAGDVRVGSVKRIAAAIGEGGAALQMTHNRLATL